MSCGISGTKEGGAMEKNHLVAGACTGGWRSEWTPGITEKGGAQH